MKKNKQLKESTVYTCDLCGKQREERWFNPAQLRTYWLLTFDLQALRMCSPECQKEADKIDRQKIKIEPRSRAVYA